ncbi:bifunctional lysylphosphatidylglycerol flippase/synthetase MprF [Rhodococcus sp. MEB064]|uniref:bifunctional lysylphosphatidylglycerol flippase/synthetase MprF n=1 Tax=Rhodococcus sp. MEB064 TaxID=1587522 RepID=UPI000698F828|nr:DUF2156 domain-containing protein [Rhodococcus sp. MEB064]
MTSSQTSVGPLVLRRALQVAAAIRWLVADAPVTVAIIATMTAATSAFGYFAGDPRFVDLHLYMGVSSIRDFHWWTPVTSALAAPSPLAYAASIALLLTCAVPLERRMRSARFFAAAVVVQILGSMGGVGLAAAARNFDQSWGDLLSASVIFDPVGWVAGVAMTASAAMPTLWRRRLRVGVPATAIVLALFIGGLSDLVILASVTVGLVLGRVVYGKSEASGAIVGTRRERRLLVSLVVLASALGPVLSIIAGDAAGPLWVTETLLRSTPRWIGEVRAICNDPTEGVECKQSLIAMHFSGPGFTILSLVPSIFLMTICDGLRRGRRSALILALIAQACLLVIAVVDLAQSYTQWNDSSDYGLESDTFYMVRDTAPLLTPLAVAVVLATNRTAFGVIAPAGGAWKAGRSIVVIFVILGTVYGAAGAIGSADIGNVPALLVDFLQRLVPNVYLQLFAPTLQAGEAVPSWLDEWIGVAFWIAVCLVVLVMFMRPSDHRDIDDPHRARGILQTSGGSNLAWMSTWRKNRYWFTSDSHSYIAYRVIGGVALTTGGPVGPDGAQGATVRGFAEFCADYGWTPCLYSIPDNTRVITDELGWSAIRVGEETILDLAGLKFTGKKFQDIRTAFNRATKGGVSAEWITYAEAPLAIRDQIGAISREWVADKSMPEMGFTLGGLTEMEDPAVRCLVAIDTDRTVHGVTSWLPVYREGHLAGWTLDFMRRRSAGFGPAVEFLIASAALSFQDEGIEFISLSGAPLATATASSTSQGGLESNGNVDRLLATLGKALEPVYGFRSLLAFKSKFQPRYDAMYMSFPDGAALPSIANAISRAYLPSMSVAETARLMRALAGHRSPKPVPAPAGRPRESGSLDAHPPVSTAKM